VPVESSWLILRRGPSKLGPYAVAADPAVICLASCARFALMAAWTFSAVAGSECTRTPTASWIALRIAAAVETQVGSPTPLAPNA